MIKRISKKFLDVTSKVIVFFVGLSLNFKLNNRDYALSTPKKINKLLSEFKKKLFRFMFVVLCFFLRIKEEISLYFNRSYIEYTEDYIFIHYDFMKKNYIIPVRKNKSVKRVIIFSAVGHTKGSEEDITDRVNAVFGPNCDWHLAKLTSKDLGYEKITIFSNKTFEGVCFDGEKEIAL